MFRSPSTLALLAALALTSCATSRGFDRGGLHSQFPGKPSVTEQDIKDVLDLKPQLPSPFKLAVYLAPGNRWGWGPVGRSWYWSESDKDVLAAAGEDLKRKGVVSEVTFIGDNVVDRAFDHTTVAAAVRLGAARVGADAVLIVDGTYDIDRYNNVLGATYFLLVTACFVPGTEAKSLFLADATLWDVRNGYLYLAAESEGQDKQVRPALFINEDGLIRAARSEAVSALAADLSSRLVTLSSK